MSNSLMKKRLYVGGLAENVTEDELRDRFARFVKVSNLTLKYRADSEGHHVKTFAHVDIQGSEENFRKFFSAYQNTKWKGCVMKLEDAKESFLERLETERQAQRVTTIETKVLQEKKVKKNEWKPPEFVKLNGPAVPGTPVPGKKDWVVGKYGRVLPILTVKKSYKAKAVKHDPSKFCHAAKVFKEDGDGRLGATQCERLTWEIDAPDSELTKKRKGEFPHSTPPKKFKLSKTSHTQELKTVPVDSGHRDIVFNSYLKCIPADNDDIEIVKVGHNVLLNSKNPIPSRFDSDSDEFSVPDEVEKKLTHLSESTQKVDQPKNCNSKQKPPIHFNVKKDMGRNIQTLKHNSSCILTTRDICRKKTQSSNSSLLPFHDNDDDNEKEEEIASENDDEEEESSDDESEGESNDDDVNEEKHKEDNNIEEEKENDNSEEEKSIDEREEKYNDYVNEDENKGGDHGKGAIPKFKGLGSLISKPDVQSSKSKELIKISTNHTSGKYELQKSDHLDKDDKRDVDMEVDRSGGKENKSTDGTESSDDEEIHNMDDEGMGDYENRNNIEEERYINEGKERTDKRICITSPEKTSTVINPVCGSMLQKKSFHSANADLTEFISKSPDFVSCHSDRNSDSCDSDLDSSDFRLVAKKLAMKVAKGSRQITNLKQNLSNYPIPRMANSGKENLNDSDNTNILVENRAVAFKNNLSDSNLYSKNNAGNKTSVEKMSDVQNKLLSLAGDDSDKGSTLDIEHSPSEQKITPSVNTTKQIADNTKRLQAVKEQMQIRQRRKDLMKAALKNVDTVSSKRIVFSSSDDSEDTDSVDENKEIINESEYIDEVTPAKYCKKVMPSRMTLLGDLSSDESDEENLTEMFKSKPHFEGKRGEKLMKMQRKIGDSRFKLDANFMESNSSNDEDEEFDNDNKELALENADDKVTLAEERKQNLHVLETVVGKHKVDKLNAKLKRDTIKIVDMNQIRFDPTKMKSTQLPEETEKPNDKLDSSERPQLDDTGKLDSCEKEIAIKFSKKEMRLKTQNCKETSDPFQEVTKSKVVLSDSLVDMLKGKDEGDKKEMSTEPSFSLLDIFDRTKEDESEGETDSPLKPLSLLLSSKSMDKECGDGKTGDSKISELDGGDGTVEKRNQVKSILRPGFQMFVNDRNNEDDDSTDDDQEKETSKSSNSNISIQTSIDPIKAHGNALQDSGRADVRFTKEEWQQRFIEIRHDLLMMCKKRAKDARRRKKVEDEHNRKKAVLKKAGKRWWWK